jgi:DNA-binding transcriptional ArsR family regulator
MKPYADVTDSRVVKALAHPLRVQILVALEERVASPNELSREFGVDLGSVSYHVRRLVHLGFITQVSQAPRRGAIEHYYTALARARVTDTAWANVPTIVKRALVDAGLETVGRQVTAAAAAGGFDVADAHLTRSPITVDDQGWRELAAELEALTGRVQAIQRESAERLSATGAAETDATVVLMLFNSAPADTVPAVGGARRPARRYRHAAMVAEAPAPTEAISAQDARALTAHAAIVAEAPLTSRAAGV